eukprot:m.145181 g.145181  ORF g.145181 m.145181 type:complete len:612 (+) comp16215_c0_seq5:869-2704(+)
MSQAAASPVHVAAEQTHEPAGSTQPDQDSIEPAEFWRPDGYRQVTTKYEDAATYLDQLQRMVSDRISLEKKIAKELNSFAKKWEGRMIKACPFPQGNYQAVAMAGSHQARAAASMHLSVATKLHDEVATALTTHGKAKYKRKLGRLGPFSEANKAFKDADGGFAKTSKATTKLQAVKDTKEQEYQALVAKRAIVAAMATDNSKSGSMDKLQSALEKKEAEVKKATDKYQAAHAKSTAAFAKFVAAMQAQYDSVEEDLNSRFVELQALTVQAVEAMTIPKDGDEREIVIQLLSAAKAAAVTDDMAKMRTVLDVHRPPAHDATVATKAVNVKTKGDVALAEQGNTKGGWFQKRGEKANAKFKKRFFVLTPTSLTYYQSLDMGVPNKKKGEVELSALQSIGLLDANLELRSAARTYFLVAGSPEQAESWATALTTQLNIPLETTVTPPPVVEAAEESEDEGPTIEEQNAAATVIQSNFRSFKEQQRFKSKKQAAVTIQSHYRGHLTRVGLKSAADTSQPEGAGAVDAPDADTAAPVPVDAPANPAPSADLAAAASLATAPVVAEGVVAEDVATSSASPADAVTTTITSADPNDQGVSPASGAAVADAIMPDVPV